MTVSDADFASAVQSASTGEGDAAQRARFSKLHALWQATVGGDGIGDVDLRDMAAARFLEYRQTWAVPEPDQQQAEPTIVVDEEEQAGRGEQDAIVVDDDEADSPVGGCPRDPTSPRAGDAVPHHEQAATSPPSVQRVAVTSPQSQHKPPRGEEEPWLMLWSRLSALGWQIETRVSAGRKDHYYIPPHRVEGSPRRLDSRVKVRRYVAAAHAHQASVPSGTPRAAGAGGDSRRLPEPRPLSLPLSHQMDIKKQRQALSQQQARPSISRQRNSPPTTLTAALSRDASDGTAAAAAAAAAAGTGIKRKAPSSLCEALESDRPKTAAKAAGIHRPSGATPTAACASPWQQLRGLVCGDTVLAQWPPDVAGFIEEGEDSAECSWYKATVTAVGFHNFVRQFALRYDDGEHDAVPWSMVRMLVPPVAAADDHTTRRRLADHALPVDDAHAHAHAHARQALASSSYSAVVVDMGADNEVLDSTTYDSGADESDDMSSDNEDEDADEDEEVHGSSEHGPAAVSTVHAAANTYLQEQPQPSPRGAGGRCRKPPPRWCDDPLATVELGGSAAKLQLIIDENSR